MKHSKRGMRHFDSIPDTASKLSCKISQVGRYPLNLNTKKAIEENAYSIPTIIEGFKRIKIPEDGDTQAEEAFFGTEIYGENIDSTLPEDLDLISEKGTKLTQMLGEALDINLPDAPLFESPGAIIILDSSGNILDSGFTPQMSLLPRRAGDVSPVSQEYSHNQLKRMGFEKALFHTLIHLLADTPLSTHLVQKYLSSIVGKTLFRGGYQHPHTGVTVGNSASSLNEEIVKIISKKQGSLEELAEKYSCGVCDILAGIGDELLGRLLLHPDDEWKSQIRIVSDDIKQRMEEGDFGLLC